MPADLEAGDEIVLYLEELFAPVVAEQVGIRLLVPPIDYLTRLPFELIQRQISLTTLGDARKINEPAFIKPPNDKSFAARVYPSGAELAPGDDAQSVLVAEPVHWQSEFRAFCLDGRVLTLSAYLREGQLLRGSDWAAAADELRDATLFAERALQAGGLPRAIVLDVGTIRDHGWAVIEANGAWASGIYGCEATAALQVIQASCEWSMRTDEVGEEAGLLQARIDRMGAGDPGIDAKEAIRQIAGREGIELPSDPPRD